MRLKIGITGQDGFIGINILNALKHCADKFEIINFKKSYFENLTQMENFVNECDVIIHAAAISRSEKNGAVYETNMRLVNILLSSIRNTNSRPYIIFSSSVHENNQSEYGLSKNHADLLFYEWASEYSTNYTNLILPNVFGPFSKPYYASFIATFCDSISNKKEPKILVDGNMKLIYINSLVIFILNLFEKFSKSNSQILNRFIVPHDFETTVSKILQKLIEYNDYYLNHYELPKIESLNEYNLFCTFHSFLKIKAYRQSLDIIQNNKKHTSFYYNQLEIYLESKGEKISYGNKFQVLPCKNFQKIILLNGSVDILVKKLTDEVGVVLNLNEFQNNCFDVPIWYSIQFVNLRSEFCKIQLLEFSL